MTRQSLAVSAVAIGMAACAGSSRRTPVAVVPTSPAAQSSGPATAPAASSRPPRPRHKGGVDLSTGLYGSEDDDLVVNTAMPIVLRRTYNSGNGFQRQFGLDWTHPGEWWLHGDGDPRIPWGDLILANGGRIHFTRISPGETQEGAVLRHSSTPTEFNGALLSWNGSLWEMRFRDGSLALFLDCQTHGEVCALVERRDPNGHRIAYVRDSSRKLLRMESDGRSIAFDYDNHKRIARAYDTDHREVSYLYDAGGRLVRATWSDGTIRDYAYDEHDKLIGVREPGRIIRNWFDESGRWVRQVVMESEQDPDPYVATARYVVENGAIVESAFDEGDGLVVRRYNAHHYIVSETWDADGPAPIVFSYNRDDASNEVHGATLSCSGKSGSVVRPVDDLSPHDKAAQQVLIRGNCLRWR